MATDLYSSQAISLFSSSLTEYHPIEEEAVPALVRERFSELPAKLTVRLYKWQDEQGRWHVGGIPPKGHRL